MLHRINPLDASSEVIFVNILAFQRNVLTFVCDPSITLPLTESAIRSSFGPTGDWFWTKLHKQSGENRGDITTFHKALKKVIEFVKENVGIGASILQAFDHDIDFLNSVDSASFRFRYISDLSAEIRQALNPLMVAFYEELFYRGYPDCVHGGSGNFNRRIFVDKFWLANAHLNVCPACDGSRPDRTDDTDASQADHYLPKKKYGFLSMHPANLVPICSDCNSPFKLITDPIDDVDDDPLVHVFMPYSRAAVDFVTVETSRTANGLLQFRMYDSDGSRSRRVDNLDRTFKLEERWGYRLKQIKGSIRDALSGSRRTIIRLGGTTNAINLQQEIADMAEDRAQGVGQNANYILHASYLRFVGIDADEFDELLHQFEGL